MAGFVKKCPCLRPQIEDDVRELDYRHCSLTDVPSEVFNFERTLEELFVDSNQIRDLPRELFYCHGIRKLSLSDNEITHIPPAIASLINLEDLDISKNGIIDMPENIKCCKYLHTVEASVNPLGKLPDGFTQLLNLTQLFLNDTFLDYLPGNFGRLSRLKILEIRENHLKTLPKSFSRLTDLERLDIGHNEFTDLPDVIGNLTGLLELWCDHNQIAQVTPMIGNLKQLMFLDCTKNRIQTLPNEIEGCVSLADLHLTGNHLQGLPESMGNLEHITTLKVDGNQLTSLPNTIGGLTSLSELNVSRNDLEDLPSSLGLLRNLRTLYADENCLEMIPAELGSCSGITVLSLRSNKLEYIPDELGRIPRLRVLNLSDNLLKFLPFSVTKLKELQALWLSENQTRPIVPFQSEIEQETGRKILTCYLLPQCASEDLGDPNGGGDTDSFHASIWDEERERRQQIHFEFTDELDEDGKLVRCPTPYPKEMREKIRHARNLAVRQKLTGDGRPWRGGEDNKAFDRESGNGIVSGTTDHGDVRLREARIAKPSSPTLQETHRLYKYDREKLAKDKARMQQNRHSSPETFVLDLSQSSRRSDNMSAISRPDSPKKGGKFSPRKYKPDDDDGGFTTRDSSRLSNHSSNPDVSAKSVGVSASTPTTESIGVTANSTSDQSGHRGMPGFAYVNPKDLEASFSQYSMFGRSVDPTYHNRKSYHCNQHRGGRHRTRDYDSDTGYRSETEVARLHRQQVLAHQQERRGYESERESRTSRRKGRDGYSSDLECYQSRGGDSRDIAYRGVPLHQQHNANSLPYDLNESQRQVNHMPHKTSNPHLSIKGSDMYLDSIHMMVNDNYKDSQKPVMRNSDQYMDQSISHAPHSIDRSLPLQSRSVDRTLPPPSPGQFHRSKIIDQSTPTTAEPPQGFPPGGIERSRSNSASGSHDDNDIRVTDQRRDMYNSSNTRDYSNRSTPSNQSNGLPPPYKPAPPYVSSPGQKKLPPTPNRNSPYGVLNYDRRGNNSPTMHQRLSGMTIQEQRESKTGPDKYADMNGMSGNVDYGRSNPTRQSKKDFNYNDRNGSDGLSDSHNDSRTSHDEYKFNYNSDRSTMSVSPDRSRTPVSSSFDEHRDSPRESGYSSREHSSHRNSPFDTPQKYNQPPPPGSYTHMSQGSYGDSSEGRVPNMSNYEDVNAFENSNSEPTSQVSSSSDSGYYHGQHFDKPAQTPSKYSDYSYPPESRYTTSPGQQYPYTPYATPVPSSPRSGGTTNPNQSNESRPAIKMIQNDLKGDKFRVTIKKNPGLGFSIAGGHGAYGNPYRAGDKGIFVTKVQSEGPAAMSLSPGDKILEVNGHDFTNIHHDDAVSIIKQCSSVSMNIERVYTV